MPAHKSAARACRHLCHWPALRHPDPDTFARIHRIPTSPPQKKHRQHPPPALPLPAPLPPLPPILLRRAAPIHMLRPSRGRAAPLGRAAGARPRYPVAPARPTFTPAMPQSRILSAALAAPAPPLHPFPAPNGAMAAHLERSDGRRRRGRAAEGARAAASEAPRRVTRAVKIIGGGLAHPGGGAGGTGALLAAGEREERLGSAVRRRGARAERALDGRGWR